VKGLGRTFCACQARDTSGFRSNVEHDGCLEPWNLERERTRITCTDREPEELRETYPKMGAFTIYIFCHTLQPEILPPSEIVEPNETPPTRVPGIFDGAVTSVN
jgi:hypothetical protein